MIFVLAILTFVSGAASEILWIVWAHYALTNNQKGLALCGFLQGLSVVIGVGEALSHVEYAVAYILGCTLGPVIGVHIKKRMEVT